MNNQSSQTIESLDLLGFLKVIFKGSWLIILVTAIFAGAAYSGTYLFQQKWKAESYVDKGTAAELGNYYLLLSTYYFVQDKQNSENPSANPEPTELVYQEFKRQLTSYDTIKSFWQNNEYYKQLQTGESAQADLALLESLNQSLKFNQGNSAKNTPDSVSLVLDNPKRASELLNAFMVFANERAKTEVYKDLIVKWKTLFNQVSIAVQTNLTDSSQQDWKAKFTIMSSTPKLDNQLQAFRYLKSPAVASKASPDRLLWASMIGFLGFLIGSMLVISLHLRKQKNLA